MPVKATCRSCQKMFQFPDWFLGRIVDCPNCKSPLLILPQKHGEATSIATTKVVAAEGPPAVSGETTLTQPASPQEAPAGAEAAPLAREAPPSPAGPAAERRVPKPPGAPAPVPRAAEPALEPAAAETGPREDVIVGSGSTSVSLVLSGLAAVVLTLLFYVFLVLPVHRLYFGELFAHRGFVPYVIMLLTFWSLTILLLKSRKIARQKASLEADPIPLEISEEITPENVLLFMEHIGTIKAKWKTSFLINRVQRALTLFGSGRSVQEVATLASSQSDIDATAILSSYKMVKVFIWAIPILGFIGTVLGIGQAVGGFSGAIQDAQNLEVIKTSLGSVTSGLAVAFDTTLVALVMSVFIMLPMSTLQTAEENLLNSIDEFCNENLLRRLNEQRETGSPDSARIVEALRIGLGELRTDLQAGGGRAAETGGTLVREIAAAWSEVRQRLDKDNQQVLQQLQEILRSVSAERRAFLEQVKAAQQEQVQQFGRVVAQFIDATQGLQDRVGALQKSQVDGLRDVLAHLKQDLQALQKQAHEQNQSGFTALQQTAGRVLESVNAVQQRAEKLPQVVTEQLVGAMGTVRAELAKVGGEAARIFQQQITPLQGMQQQIEASLKRSAAYLESASQSEASVRKLSEQQLQQATAAANRFVETLNAQLLKMHQEIAAGETKGQTEHQKRMEETSRRLQLVANLSSERLETLIKTGASMSETMNRSQEKLAEQTRHLADVIQGQQALAKTQDLLARNLAAVQTSGQLLSSVSATPQLIGQLTPVLERLSQQVERLATSAVPDVSRSKRGWLPWS